MHKVLSSLEGLYSRVQYLEKRDKLGECRKDSNKV